MADNIAQTEDQKKALALLGGTPDTSAKTQEQIDAEAAAAKEQADAEAAAKEKEQADTAAAQAEADRLALENKVTAPDYSTLTDDQLAKIIAERTGKQINSLDDLRDKPSEDAIRQQQEQREADKVAFGLHKGKFNNADYQSYLSDLKEPAAIVFEQYKQEALALDNELTDEELESEFNEKYGLDLDEESRKRKRGVAEIAALADGLIAKKHKKIFDAAAEYEGVLTAQESDRQVKEKITKTIGTYQSDVKEAAASVKNLSFKIGDENIEVDIDAAVVQSVVARMNEDSFAASQIVNGYDKAHLADTLEKTAYLEDFNRIVIAAAEQYHLKKAAGLRGIPPKNVSQEARDPDTLTEAQRVAINHFKERLPQPQPLSN